MSDDQRRPHQAAGQPDTSALARGLADVIQAGLAAGTALARVTAEATAGGRPVGEPRQSDNALNALVHYSIASVVNVVDAIVQGVQDARVDAATGAGAASRRYPGDGTGGEQQSAASQLPAVHAGASLRLPLSIQNPGTEAMETLIFRCLELRSADNGAAAVIGPEQLRFEPQTLTIAPLDFEKLTVFIDVPTEAPAGYYEAIIGTTSGAMRSTIGFNVLPADVETA